MGGTQGGAVVRALASQKCGPGPIPGPGVMWGEFVVGSLLVPRGFSPGTPVFPSPRKPTFLNSNLICGARTHVNEFLRALSCYVGK